VASGGGRGHEGLATELGDGGATADGARQRWGETVADTQRGGVRRRVVLFLHIQVREAVSDGPREAWRELMTEGALQPVRVRVTRGTCTGGTRTIGRCTFETQQPVGRAETQGGPGGHLVRQPGPEGVTQRFLPTGGKALRRNEIRVAIHRVRLGGGQRESWRRTVETAADKTLTIQRVVEAALPLVQFGGERIAAVHLVRGAVDEERDGWAEARDEVPPPVLVVEKKIDVGLLGHRN